MKKELISMIEQMDESKAENIYYFIKEAFDSSEEPIKDEVKRPQGNKTQGNKAGNSESKTHKN